MPGMDGYEVMRRLKEDRGTADIPVVVLTAKTGEHDRMMAYDCGATRYVRKPFTEEKLLREVERALGASGCTGALPN